ncbi:hypothetical protein HDU76_007838 [Blyttiomyces sp. JEL0837]|nr:hypothetical protein HDU76_007838 [Blyttiomyces sp. JEL0837]
MSLPHEQRNQSTPPSPSDNNERKEHPDFGDQQQEAAQITETQQQKLARTQGGTELAHKFTEEFKTEALSLEKKINASGISKEEAAKKVYALAKTLLEKDELKELEKSLNKKLNIIDKGDEKAKKKAVRRKEGGAEEDEYDNAMVLH